MRSRSFTLPTLAAVAAVAVVATLAAGCGKKPAPAADSAPPYAAPAPAASGAAPQVARAVLTAQAGGSVAGTVTFTEQDGQVRIVAEVTGAQRPGKHGFHIHETGECVGDFTSAGGHFNPGDAPHGCPSDAVRHSGDFNNIGIGADGSGRLELTSDLITVADGPTSVVGRAVIFHDGTDDCVTQPTGDAGGRLACGIVERAATP